MSEDIQDKLVAPTTLISCNTVALTLARIVHISASLMLLTILILECLFNFATLAAVQD